MTTTDQESTMSESILDLSLPEGHNAEAAVLDVLLSLIHHAIDEVESEHQLPEGPWGDVLETVGWLSAQNTRQRAIAEATR